MPNDISNGSITEATGQEIVEAIRGLSGGGSHSDGNGNDIPFLFVKQVSTYPGEGEDPYADAHQSSCNWLEITAADLLNANANGLMVFAKNEYIDRISLNDLNEDTNYHAPVYLPTFYNAVRVSYVDTSDGRKTQYVFEFRSPDGADIDYYYVAKEDDYLCSDGPFAELPQ